MHYQISIASNPGGTDNEQENRVIDMWKWLWWLYSGFYRNFDTVPLILPQVRSPCLYSSSS